MVSNLSIFGIDTGLIIGGGGGGYRQLTDIMVDTGTTGCSMVCQQRVYRIEFLQHVFDNGHRICHLEALNTIMVLRQWAPSLAGQ